MSLGGIDHARLVRGDQDHEPIPSRSWTFGRVCLTCAEPLRVTVEHTHRPASVPPVKEEDPK